MTFWNLRGLSDEQLLQGARALVQDKGLADARLVAHLVEVEERRLHLAAACPSLFEYCRRRLGLSESEAFHRITAARLAARFSPLFDLLESRALTLSAVCLLRDYLTPENHIALLDAASHKSKREVETLLAERFPAAPGPASLRKLPTRKVQPLCTPPASSTSRAPNSRELAPRPSPATSTAPTTPAPLPDTSLPPPEAHFLLKLDVSARFKAKLEAATALLSHSNPGGHLEVTIERGLDLLIAQLEKERWAKTARPQPPRAPDAPARRQSNANHGEARGEARPEPRAAKSSVGSSSRARIKNHVRRAVLARDGAGCSYVSPDGERCSARSFLQLHHVEPWARGGPDTAENLQLVCAAHNRFFAERDFGRRIVSTLPGKVLLAPMLGEPTHWPNGA